MNTLIHRSFLIATKLFVIGLLAVFSLYVGNLSARKAIAEADISPPVSASILINFGNSITNDPKVKLNLGASDPSGVGFVMLSNDADFTNGQWETFFETKFWTLSAGDGEKTVYAKFKDNAGNISRVVSANIKLDSSFKLPTATPPPSSAICPISADDLTKLKTEIEDLKKSLAAEKADKTKVLEVAQAAKKALDAAQLIKQTPTPVGIVSKSFKVGDEDKEVTALQNFFKSQGPEIYPEGKVTGYYGQATVEAIKKFQEKHNLAKAGEVGYGELGPKTRAMINWLASAPENLATAPASSVLPAAPPTPPAAKAVPTLVIKTKLVVGAKGDDIAALQSFFKAQGEDVYPEGKVTGYYGPATIEAIKNFQEKYNIANPGEAGYGELGPRTRAKINELLAQQ